MRLRVAPALALAFVSSLALHTLLLGLLPLMGGHRAKSSLPPARLQVRMLPTDTPAIANLQPPSPEIEAKPRTRSAPNSPQQQQTTVRKQPALAATSVTATVPQAAPSGAPGDGGTAAAPATSSPATAPEPRNATAPLNLSVPIAKLPPRTALQTTIEQQAIQPDPVARSFERALAQTAPVTTEITQTVDASGNTTVKVRTPGGTYCLKNSTPAGATPYELKTLAGNCPK
jgi:hypothetical protein